MKKYLLPYEGNFYKANLHCHTTVSDGNMTPQDVKDEYTAHGYSIVAFTDHDVLIPHMDLNDEGFLALNGFEMEAYVGEEYDPMQKCAHFCFVALEQDNVEMPFSIPMSLRIFTAIRSNMLMTGKPYPGNITRNVSMK